MPPYNMLTYCCRAIVCRPWLYRTLLAEFDSLINPRERDNRGCLCAASSLPSIARCPNCNMRPTCSCEWPRNDLRNPMTAVNYLLRNCRCFGGRCPPGDGPPPPSYISVWVAKNIAVQMVGAAWWRQPAIRGGGGCVYWCVCVNRRVCVSKCVWEQSC